MEIPSKWLNEAVEQMSSLPGIGKKTALRLVLSILKKDEKDLLRFGKAFIDLKENIKECSTCHNISDSETCLICLQPHRDKSVICVIEDIRDVMAIENTGQFRGTYHVLGGVISPMDGIGPSDLNTESLIKRAELDETEEIILALSSTMEGDTTNFYLFKKLAHSNVKVSQISRGIGVGDELEYTDEITLARSIKNRIPYEGSLSR